MHIINADAKSATRIRKTGRKTAQVKSYVKKTQPSSKGGFKYFSDAADMLSAKQSLQLQFLEAKYSEILLLVLALQLPSKFQLYARDVPAAAHEELLEQSSSEALHISHEANYLRSTSANSHSFSSPLARVKLKDKLVGCPVLVIQGQSPNARQSFARGITGVRTCVRTPISVFEACRNKKAIRTDGLKNDNTDCRRPLMAGRRRKFVELNDANS